MKPSAPPPEGGGDPWAAFGYVVAGVGLYGGIGWWLSSWLRAGYLLPIGILIGAGLGLLLVYFHFGRIPASPELAPHDTGKTATTTEPGQDDTGATTDRGETE